MAIYGWDMSHFDAPGIGTALAEGISFITHKAGGDVPDAEIGAWWAAVKDLPRMSAREFLDDYRGDPLLAGFSGQVLLGAYWVLYPGNPVGRADAFLARLDATCPGWRDGPFILQADCEKWGGDPATMPSRADIEAFCDRLVAKVPKLTPIVYAPKWAYGDTLTGLSYPLWASSYVPGTGGFKTLYPGDASSRWAAYSGQTPEILQYSSSATIGGQTTCDANAYRGTLAELTALLAPGWETDVNLTDKVGSQAYPGRTVAQVLNDLETLRGFLIGDPKDTKYSGVAATSPVAKLVELPAQVAALSAAVAQLAGKDLVDEPAIVAGVLAGLSPEKIAAAIPAELAERVVDELSARISRPRA